MSSPGKIRSVTLQTLRGTRRDMSRAKWLLAVKRRKKDVRRRAACTRLDVEQALLELGTAKLADIGKKLEAHKAELKASQDNLKKARRRLERVGSVLNATDKLLGTIGKIVKLTSSL